MKPIKRLGEKRLNFEIALEALRYGVYDKKARHKVCVVLGWSSFDQEYVLLEEGFNSAILPKRYYFCDYGKTWALTKEELL